MSGQRWIRSTAAVICSLSLLTSCGLVGGKEGESEEQPSVSTDHFGYQVPSDLVTTNAGSAFGAASNAQFLSGRLYPAAFLPGPDGQLIPNKDLIQAQEVERTPEGWRQIWYRISDEATYSDGVPVSCEDFLLAYTAGVKPAEFGSHMPLSNDIERMDCAPGMKDFVVVLKPNRGERWRYLFGPGTVLPSHAIAGRLGIDQQQLVDALRSEEPAQLADIAQAWRWGFMLKDFDPAMQVSYGPFVIDHVGENGEVILVRNASYYGDAAALNKLVVWPSTADSTRLVSSGALRIADTTGGKPVWLDQPESPRDYDVISEVGELTETLILSAGGLFADEGARRAFAACIDQRNLAEISSAISGVQVEPVYIHSLRHGDPIAHQFSSINDQHSNLDLATSAALSGSTIKIGYLGPDKRFAAMVEAIKQSCQPAGIVVEDASTEFMSATYLENNPDTGLPTIDAFLGAVDPMTEYSTVDARIGRVDELKRAEEDLWISSPAIPVAAQPRTFVIDKTLDNVVPFSGLVGVGWNMDRWELGENSPNGKTNTSNKVGSKNGKSN